MSESPVDDEQENVTPLDMEVDLLRKQSIQDKQKVRSLVGHFLVKLTGSSTVHRGNSEFANRDRRVAEGITDKRDSIEVSEGEAGSWE